MMSVVGPVSVVAPSGGCLKRGGSGWGSIKDTLMWADDDRDISDGPGGTCVFGWELIFKTMQTSIDSCGQCLSVRLASHLWVVGMVQRSRRNVAVWGVVHRMIMHLHTE